jgi:predicted PolB exonuclease-like 3'-5' exonuclease
MNVFIFDIETIPDIETGKALHNLYGSSDKEVADTMFARRREETGGSEFLRLHLQKIVAISVVLRHNDHLKVWSLGDIYSTEKELIERFFTGIEKYGPTLVSWNGGGFDLPVLHYRSLLHGVSASRYWEIGEQDTNFRWNNYLNRYHYRHTDLMDVMAAYQPRANAPLDEVAAMLQLPGKMGKSGNLVWEYYQHGELETIRNYCETDVLNTYLIFLRFELMRGKLTLEQYQQEQQRVKTYLLEENKPHWQEFLQAWKSVPN